MTEKSTSPEAIKTAIREGYTRAIESTTSGCCGTSSATAESACCGGGSAATAPAHTARAEALGYDRADLEALPEEAVRSTFGNGNPLAMAGLKTGDVVLDIGSGAGLDCLIAARKVGPEGRVIGLDMTRAMIDVARRNAASAGLGNVTFRLGEAESMPVRDASVDWVISNCVINLAPDKPKVFEEISRVLVPGGRVSISDIVSDKPLPANVREDLNAYVGCVAGAVPEDSYLRALGEAGLEDVTVVSRSETGSAGAIGDVRMFSIRVEARKPEAR